MTGNSLLHYFVPVIKWNFWPLRNFWPIIVCQWFCFSE